MRRHLAVQEMPSYHAILASVSAGTAVGIVPRSLLALQREVSDLQTVPVRTVHTYLIRRAGFSTRPSMPSSEMRRG
jgi:DNA-binding transcriptional LysR family regulator